MTRPIFGVDEPPMPDDGELCMELPSARALLVLIEAGGHALGASLPRLIADGGDRSWQEVCATCGEVVTYDLVEGDPASAPVLAATFGERLLEPCRGNRMLTAEMPYRGELPGSARRLPQSDGRTASDDANRGPVG